MKKRGRGGGELSRFLAWHLFVEAKLLSQFNLCTKIYNSLQSQEFVEDSKLCLLRPGSRSNILEMAGHFKYIVVGDIKNK